MWTRRFEPVLAAGVLCVWNAQEYLDSVTLNTLVLDAVRINFRYGSCGDSNSSEEGEDKEFHSDILAVMPLVMRGVEVKLQDSELFIKEGHLYTESIQKGESMGESTCSTDCVCSHIHLLE